jgi:hypothetical protein
MGPHLDLRFCCKTPYSRIIDRLTKQNPFVFNRRFLAMLYFHQDEIPVPKKITGQDGPPFSTPPFGKGRRPLHRSGAGRGGIYEGYFKKQN